MNGNKNWQRRHALHLASLLPDNPEDAILVLQYAREAVEKFFLPKEDPPGVQDGAVVPLRKR